MSIFEQLNGKVGYIIGAGRSKDGKTIVKNFSYLSLLQIANYIFPLITVPYMSRVIGVEGYGRIAFASAIIIWFQTFSRWGFEYSAMREVAQNRDDAKKISEVFSNIFWSRLLLMMISYVVLIIVIFCVPTFREAADVIIVTSLLLIGDAAFPSWFFLATERMKYTTIINVLARLLFTISVFIFIRKPEDYIMQPLLNSLGCIVSGIVAMYIILIQWKVKLVWISFGAAWTTIRDSFSIFINSFAPNLYNSFTTIILGFVGGNTSNGLYDAGRKFVSMTYPLFSMISVAFFPYLNRRTDNHTKYAKMSLSLAFIVSLTILLAAPILVKVFYGESFADAVVVTRISSFALFFMVMNNVYGVNFLLILHKDRLVRNITLAISFFGALIAYPIIYMYDYIGAVAVYMIATILMGVVPALFSLKIKKQLSLMK